MIGLRFFYYKSRSKWKFGYNYQYVIYYIGYEIPKAISCPQYYCYAIVKELGAGNTEGAGSLHLSGLSILDFNTFRSKVEDGFNIVDQKIRDILAVVEPSCPKTLSTLIRNTFYILMRLPDFLMALSKDCGLK